MGALLALHGDQHGHFARTYACLSSRLVAVALTIQQRRQQRCLICTIWFPANWRRLFPVRTDTDAGGSFHSHPCACR